MQLIQDGQGTYSWEISGRERGCHLGQHFKEISNEEWIKKVPCATCMEEDYCPRDKRYLFGCIDWSKNKKGIYLVDTMIDRRRPCKQYSPRGMLCEALEHLALSIKQEIECHEEMKKILGFDLVF